MATTDLKLVISAKDQASGKLANLSSSIKTTTNNFAGLKTASKLAGVAIAGLATKVAVDAVKASAQFSKSMGNVATLIDTSTESMADMEDQVKKIARRVPVSLEDLTSSLYDVRSAGVSASDAMAVLEQSARLATAGLSSAKEATNIMTSAMNSFASEGLKAEEIADILFKTVKAGKTTVSELAISFGASAPVIADAGVKLADFQSATSALTTTGLPASQAQMGLRQAIVSLIKPTGDMEKLFKGLGTSGKELVAESDNMGQAFQKLKDEADKQNVSWSKSLGSVEALNAVTGILTTTNEAYTETLKNMNEGSNEIDEAFEKQNEQAWAQYEIYKNNLNVVLIDLGNKIMPKLIQALQWLNEVLEPEVLKIWVEDWKRIGKTIAFVENPIKSITEKIEKLRGVLDGTKRDWNDLSDLLSKGITGTIKIFEKFKERQFGGSVQAGNPVVVGEHRPEVFVPSQSGNIRQVDQAGGGKTVNVNFNNVSVRNDNDLQTIISEVKRTLQRDNAFAKFGIRT